MQADILNYIENNRSKKRALFVGIIILIGFFRVTDELFEKFIPNTSYRACGYLCVTVAWVIFWWYKRSFLPSNLEGKIGIIICVETENDKQKNRLKNDFTQRIRELVAQKNLRHHINVVLLSNYQAGQVVNTLEKYANNRQDKAANTEWEKVRKKTRGHFYIYGRIKERLAGQNNYYLDLQALVVHAPVRLSVQKQISQDLINVWLYQISFQEKAEFHGFQFAAETIFVAVQYIVGVAALVTGDIKLAFDLHNGLDGDTVFLKSPQLPNLLYVKSKLKGLRAIESALMARHYVVQKSFDKAEQFVERSLSIEPTHDAYVSKALIEFSHYNNPNGSLQAIYKAKELATTDGTWRYNEAFLLMYVERFTEALQVYQQILNISYPGEDNTLAQVYEFNENFIKEHPDKIQSLFIIGLLKYKKHFNYPGALGYFERFLLDGAACDKYHVLRMQAQKAQEEIKKHMNL